MISAFVKTTATAAIRAGSTASTPTSHALPWNGSRYVSSYSASTAARTLPSRLSSENVDDGGIGVPGVDLRGETLISSAAAMMSSTSPAPFGVACANTAGDVTSAGTRRCARPIADSSIAASTAPRPRTSPTFSPPESPPSLAPPFASSYRNRLDPAYPQSSAANAANTTRFAGVIAGSVMSATDRSAAAYASAAASRTTRPDIAALAPCATSWNIALASSLALTSTNGVLSGSSPPSPRAGVGGEVASTEKPPTGRHERRARQYSEFSSVTLGTPSRCFDDSADSIGRLDSDTLSGFTYFVSWFMRANVLARSVPSASSRTTGKFSNRRSVAPNPCGFHWCVPGSSEGRSSAWGYAGCGEKLAPASSVALISAPSPTSTNIPLTRPRQPSVTGSVPSRYSRIALGNTAGGSSRVRSPPMDRTHPMSSHR